MSVGVGDLAPGFSLEGAVNDERSTYTLSEHRGTPVVLVFYPGDASPVCTRQLNSYNENIGEFAGLGATILGLSPQSVDSHVKFSCGEGGFEFPLLADIGKQVGEAYGILGPFGLYRRSVFVLDPEGVIQYAHRAVTGMTYRSTDEIVGALNALD